MSETSRAVGYDYDYAALGKSGRERQKLSLWLFRETYHANAGDSRSPAFPTPKHCFCSSGGKLIVPDELSAAVFSLYTVRMCVFPKGKLLLQGQ